MKFVHEAVCVSVCFGAFYLFIQFIYLFSHFSYSIWFQVHRDLILWLCVTDFEYLLEH